MPRKESKNCHSTTRSEAAMSDQGHIFGQLMRSQTEDTSDKVMHEPETSFEHPVSDETQDGEELV